MTKNTDFKKWPYFLAGIIVGVLIYWLSIKFIKPLVTARQMQKEISQDLASGKFSDFQKHMKNFQKVFPAVGDFSEEKINKMMKELGINKQENPSPRDKKKIKV